MYLKSMASVHARPRAPRRRRQIGCAAVLALTVSLAACGGDDDGGSAAATSETATSETASTSTAGTDETSATATSSSTEETTTSSRGTDAATLDTATTASASATSSEGADDEALADLVAAAEAEGELRLDMTHQEPYIQAYVAAFTKDYPNIDVTYRRDSGTALRALEEQEIQTGTEQFDLVSTASSGREFVTWKERDLLLPLTELPGYDDIPEDWQHETTVTTEMSLLFTIYNSDVVSEDQVPTSWQSLTDPSLSGLVSTSDPVLNGSVGLGFTQLYFAQGEDLIDALGANDLQLFATTSENAQALGAGQSPIAIMFGAAVAQALFDSGAPVASAPMPDTPIYTIHMGVYSKAKNPNAAKLFINWLLTSPNAAAVARQFVSISALDIDVANYGQIHPLLEGFSRDLLLTVPPLEDATPELAESIGSTLGF